MSDWRIRNQWGEPYEPLATQLAFHQSKAERKSYIGVLGSGKTLAGSVEALTKAVEKPGHRPGRTVIARYTYPQLIKTTWDTFSKVVKHTCPDLIEKERKSTYEVSMTLKNGWEFLGSNLRHFQDFGSLDADHFWIDEACDDGVDLAAYNMLSGRLRSGRMGAPTGWLTGNPGGKNWVYQLFYKAHFEGTKKIPGFEGFLPGPKENIYIPTDYLDKLRLTYPDDWIAKLLEGSFDLFEGMIFDTLDHELHFIEPFTIPPEWPRYRGLDHGWTNPTACAWLAQDFDGNFFVYNTYYKRCAVPQANAQAILQQSQHEEDMIQWTVIDRAATGTQTAGGHAQTIQDQYREAGLHTRLGDSSSGAIKSGIAKIKQLLQPEDEHVFPRWHADTGKGGSPRLFIFRDRRDLISEMQQYQWRQVPPGGIDKEVPLAKHNHLIDALRYVVLEMPRAPKVSTVRTFDWLTEALGELSQGHQLESPRNLIGA